MGYLTLEIALFVPGLLIFLIGRLPLSRRRIVRDSAARLVGAVLLIPLPLYLIACKRGGVSPLGEDPLSLDPLQREGQNFVRLAALMAAFASVLTATVLALISSEARRR